MEAFLIELVSKYPVAASVIGVIGTARVIFKPIMTGVQAWVANSPSKKDDELLAKVEANGIYKAFLWVLDFAFSIKKPS